MAVGETVGSAMLFWDAINKIAQKKNRSAQRPSGSFFSEVKLPDKFRPSTLFCEELPLLLLSGFLLGLLLRGLFLLLYGLLLFLNGLFLFLNGLLLLLYGLLLFLSGLLLLYGLLLFLGCCLLFGSLFLLLSHSSSSVLSSQ